MGPGRFDPTTLIKGSVIRPPAYSMCDRQTVITPYIIHDECYQVSVHNSCQCNELHALYRRHLIARNTELDVEFLQTMLPVNVDCERISYDEVVSGYTGRKKRMYYGAMLTLIQSPWFLHSWSRVKMFVKPDRYPAADIYDKIPRAIQYRKPEFNLLLATYLKPYEHAFYENALSNIGLRSVAKGLNNFQRAANLVEAATYFRNPVYVLCDHSKFDSHVTVHHLKWVHQQYLRTYPHSYLLRALLKYQLTNKGTTKSGIKYTVKGTRMSGDYDTALGNTLLNYAILNTCFNHIKNHIFLDGDDSVIIVESDDLNSVDFSMFSRLGMTTETQVVREAHEVEFCRAKLYPEGPLFMRNHKRSLSNLCVSLKTYTGEGIKRYYAGVGVGELCINNGVPIMGPIALKLASYGKPLELEEYKYYGAYEGYQQPTDDARLAYYNMFGVSPEEQIRIERDFVPPLEFPTDNEDKYLSLNTE